MRTAPEDQSDPVQLSQIVETDNIILTTGKRNITRVDGHLILTSKILFYPVPKKVKLGYNFLSFHYVSGAIFMSPPLGDGGRKF